MKKNNFGVCLKLAVLAGLVAAPGSRAEDKGGEPTTVYDWDSVLNAYIPHEICKESDKCECGGGGGDSGGGGQSATADPALKCVQMDIGLGAPRYSALSGTIVLQLNELQASSRLYSSDGFHVVAGYTVHRVSRQTNAGGVPKWVQMATPSGVVTEYAFADGESVGVPVSGREDVSSGRLAMVDAQGWATATDPAFYDYYPGDGARWRFGAARGASDYLGLIEHQTPQGRMETKQDLGLEVIRDANGALRQVATPARLADFVVAGQDAYDLTVYPNDALCVTEVRTSEGYYAIAAGAVPEVIWRFRNPTPGTYGVLEVTREMPGAGARTWRYEYVEAVQDFVLRHPGGIKEERVERIENDDKTSRTVRRTELGPDGVAYLKKELRYETRGGSLELVASVNDPGGLNLTTAYDYYTEGANVGLERMSVSPDGSWTRYEYDGQKRKTAVVTPWLDLPTTAPNDQCAVTRYGYGLFAAGDFLAYNDQRPRTEIKEICGIEVSRTYRAYPTNALSQAQEIEELAAFPGAPYGHAANPRTVKTYYASTAALPLPGRLATVAYPGGKTETYGYEYGTFNAATFTFAADPDGGAWRETVTTSYGANSGVQALRSARVWNEKGLEVLDESYVEDGASFALIGWTRMSYDRNGKLTETAYSDGRIVSATWGANCCGKESETSAEGIITVYGYNELKQKVSETKKGLAEDGADDLTTLYTYDLNNRVLSVAVTNYVSGLGYVESRNAYDHGGRLTNAWDRLGNATVTEYAANGTVTVRKPNGVVSVTWKYEDGRIRLASEDGVVRQAQAYGVTPEGQRWTLSAEGALPGVEAVKTVAELCEMASALDCQWTLMFRDSFGQPAVSMRSGFGRTVLAASNAYDDAGNLLSSVETSCRPDGTGTDLFKTRLYAYADDGSRLFSALDLNTNGVIDLAGPDRIDGSAAAYEKAGADWWRVSRTWVYPEFNSSAAVTTSVRRVRLTGLGVRQDGDGVLVSQAETLEVRGNNVTSFGMIIDRTARKVTQVTALPTSVQPEVRVSLNGVLLQTVSSTAVTNMFDYDLFGRQTASTDGRGNTTVTAYNALGQVLYTEDAATNRTAYGYDFLGRRTSVTDAIGNVTHMQYDAEGRVTKNWGATYPVEFGYDSQGHMVSMKTFRDENEAGDETIWLYDSPTGLLTNKVYADGLGPAYTYTADGKLAARKWARLNPGTGEKLSTLYSYDATGSLSGLNYLDTTPDITYTYDRLGNMATVTDASGVRSFVHSPDGQPLTDAIRFLNDVFTLHEAYDSSGRSVGYALSNTVEGASSLATGITQAYDALGRIVAVAVSDIPSLFRYGYIPGTDLQQSLAMPNGVTRQTTYDPHRNLPASIVNTNAAGTILTRRTFSYDAIGRLTNRTQYRLGDETNRIDTFGYSPRSELAAAVLGAKDYAYLFDPIGNRTTSSELSASSIYSANTLNQYTVISNFVPAEPSFGFFPVFDADGNQTRIRTSTGYWHVTYNAENRPIVFSNDTTVVEMAYDYMGRRFFNKETVNGVVSRHERYLYRNTSLIVTLSLNVATNTMINAIAWDGVEPKASCPLAILYGTNWWCYSFDQVKNVTELLSASGNVTSRYSYAPFGSIIEKLEPFKGLSSVAFSSEIDCPVLGLVQYNNRCLNPCDGRWLSRDPLYELGQNVVWSSSVFMVSMIKSVGDRYLNEYLFVSNNPVGSWDTLGLGTCKYGCFRACTLCPVGFCMYLSDDCDTCNEKCPVEEGEVGTVYHIPSGWGDWIYFKVQSPCESIGGGILL